MPSMTGGSQASEEYAPHLYYDGECVGAKEAKRLKAKDKRIRKGEIKALLGVIGLNDFDYEASGYVITDQNSGGVNTDWDINKEGFALGTIYGEGHVIVTYQIGSDAHKPTFLRQIELAGELVTELRNYGCDQLIEVPSRRVLIPKLEEMVRRSGVIIEELKQ